MEVVCPRCAGLDVHKKTVVACVLAREGRETLRAVQTFGTTTPELRTLQTWLTEHRVTHVAMESTARYWEPVYNLLERGFTTWLVNAAHIQAVPGRKTDVKDAEWIADLLQHGLLQPSFIPDRGQRELRELTRYRKSLIEERAREVNRIQKVLEGANIKLGSVVSNVLGVSGTRIVRALAAGTTAAAALAALADDRIRATPEELQRPRTGSWARIHSSCSASNSSI
jgi:transposase